MIDPPEVVQTTAQPAAVIRVTVPRAEMMKVFGPGIQELMSTLKAQGVAPAGPVFDHHLKMPSNVFDFELGVPVASPVKAAGRVQPGELPAARVARTVYHGPYEGLPGAWGEFDAWMKGEGLQRAPNLWQRYLAGPESGPDASKYRTELNRPLIE